MPELSKQQKQTALKTVEEILQRCRPLLVGFGGSIAYGLHTPESDIDIRGIFLNPREEWIGLKPETENLRLNDSDTVLYGLRKAMKLLLGCNPNVIELLGLRPEHILYCTDEGRKILDQPSVFLSKKAIFTFNSFAVKLRKHIQDEVAKGKADRKTICKEMSHLIRIYAMGGELLENGIVLTYREREHELLTDIRAGKYLNRHKVPTMEYEHLLEDYIGAFNAAAIRTYLPPEPDWEKANELTMEIAGAYL